MLNKALVTSSTEPSSNAGQFSFAAVSGRQLIALHRNKQSSKIALFWGHCCHKNHFLAAFVKIVAFVACKDESFQHFLLGCETK